MKDLILGLAAVALIGTYAVLISWIVIEKRKARQERQDCARYIRARGLLNLSKKPYILPKQGADKEIEIIRGPQDPPDPGELEMNCRRFKSTDNPHFRKFLEEAERIGREVKDIGRTSSRS